MALRLLCKPSRKELISTGYVLSHCRWEKFNKKVGDFINCDAYVVQPFRTMATATKESQKCVTLENMNENIIRLEYAVRGPIVIRAGEIEKELEQVIPLRKIKI